MISFSEEECLLLLDAFHLLQVQDLLGRFQVALAVRIMDRYPELNDKYRYLRNGYEGL